ncbi:MAG: phasin family protein [Parvibaculum sp.]|uniref:phasin family protein n=1 Tax=Parvibaculum sp. TaxID=2024848 RepID=UPI0034A022F1
MPRISGEMPDLSRDVMSTLAASAATAAETAARINSELLEFTRQRFEKDASIAEAMLKAESVADMIALQREYLVSVFESYTEETNKIRNMAMDMTKDVTGRVTDRLAKQAA